MCRPPLSFLCSAVKTLKLQAFLYFIFFFFLWWVGSSGLEKGEKQQLSTALLPGSSSRSAEGHVQRVLRVSK